MNSNDSVDNNKNQKNMYHQCYTIHKKPKLHWINAGGRNEPQMAIETSTQSI